MSSKVDFTDLFCGLGGSTLGALWAGIEGRTGINHWKKALESYLTNHPHIDGWCGDAFSADPRRFPRTTFLLASPECTTHSIAGGRKRAMKEPSLIYDPDPSIARSRVTMWDVVRFTEAHRYEFIIVENVVDIKAWLPYDAWLMAMAALGYEHQAVYLNAMFFPPTPQSRDRIFIVFWKKGNKRPNLDYRPAAWCETCEKNINAVQTWKNTKRRYGKWGKHGQYLYRCPACRGVVTPYYYAAANIIDWNAPIIRIGDREKYGKRPLRPRTLTRLESGLKRFIGRQLIIPLEYAHGHNERAKPIIGPLPTITGSATMGLACPPLLIPTDHTQDEGRVRSAAEEPMPAQTARQSMGLALTGIMTMRGDYPRGDHPVRSLDAPLSTVVASATQQYLVQMPQILSYYSRDDAQAEVDRPLPTVTTEPRHALVTAPFLATLYGTSETSDVENPVGTITAGGINYGLVHHNIAPFLMSYYGNQAGYQAIDEPVSTIRTVQAHALVQPGEIPAVEDCYFRMFTPGEILRAQAFPADYVVIGTNREKVKQIGNAVPPTMEAYLVGQCVASLN